MPPPSELLCCLAEVAVSAPDVALLDLGGHIPPRTLVANELCNMLRLYPPDVVELQHDGVCLATVDTRVVGEVGKDPAYQVRASGLTPFPGLGLVGIQVRAVVAAMVLLVATSAVRLELRLAATVGPA
jgi:hypothetical protein